VLALPGTNMPCFCHPALADFSTTCAAAR
jgi:hypothetical protein